MSTEFVSLNEVFLPVTGGDIEGSLDVNGLLTVNDKSGNGTVYDVADEIAELKAVSRFSTSETNTGQTWIDGSAIYRKVYEIGVVAAGSSVTVASGLLSVNIVRVECVTYDVKGRMVPVPFSSTSGTTGFRDILMQDNGDLLVRCGSDATISRGCLILEYTK